MKDKLEGEKGLGSCDADWTREALLKAVADCWPNDGRCTGGKFLTKSRFRTHDQAILCTEDGAIYLHLWHEQGDAFAAVALLSEIETKGFDWDLCRYDDSADPGRYHLTVKSKGDDWGWEWKSFSHDSIAWVVCLAFVAVFGKRTSQPTDTPQGLSHSQIPSPKFEEQDVKL